MKRQIAGRFDAPTLILVGIAVALVAAYWGIVALSQDYYLVDAPPGSVFSSADEGFKVLYAYLDELGVECGRLEGFGKLPVRGTIVAAASQPFEKQPTRAQTRRLREWIEGGGRLVLVGRYAGDVAGFAYGESSGGTRETALPLLLPSVYAQGVDRVKVGEERVLEAGAEWVTHLKDGHGQALVSRAQGAGEIVWLASPLPLSNAGIGEADNARLATLLVASAGPVYFDEYHHGFVRGGGVWERLGAGGRSGVLLAALALAVLLYAASRRPGPPIPALPEPVARTGEYVASLAELYRKAGARGEALDSLGGGLRGALAHRYGDVETGLARHPDARELLGRTAEKMDEKRFVATARGIARVRQEVDGRNG